MTLSLDANVLIDLANDEALVIACYRRALRSHEEVALSVIAWQELRVGALLERQSAGTQDALDRLIAGMQVVDYEQQDADVAARLRSGSRRGDAGVHDVMIAGQAIARGWTLVTSNTRDFAKFDGLTHVNWRDT